MGEILLRLIFFSSFFFSKQYGAYYLENNFGGLHSRLGNWNEGRANGRVRRQHTEGFVNTAN